MNKILLSAALTLMVLGIGFAAPIDYNISMKVLPGTAHENNNVTVFGYIELLDWGNANSITDMNLRLVRKGDLDNDWSRDNFDDEGVRDYPSSEIEYHNDINDSELLLDGFFYKDLGMLRDGDYVIQLRIDDKMVDYKRFNVLDFLTDGSSNLAMDFIEVAQSSDEIKLLVDLYNNNDSSALNVNLSIYGRKNFDNPQQVTGINISPGEKYELPESNDTYSIDLFADENQVFGLVLFASNLLQNASPAIVVLNTGLSTIAYDGELSITLDSVKKNEETEAELSISNKGLLTATYSILVSGSLSSYVQISDDSLTLMPGEEVTVTLTLNIPKDYDGNNDLKIILMHDEIEISSITLNPELITADKEHLIIIKSINYKADQFFPDQNIEGSVTIENAGDYFEEFVRIEISYGGDIIKQQVSMNQGQSKDVGFTLEPQGTVELSVKVITEDISTEMESTIPLVDKVYSFTLVLSEHELISDNQDVETVNLTVENKGNNEDYYTISTSGHDYYTIDPKENFLLSPGENETIIINVNIPPDEDEINMSITVNSKLGNESSTEYLLIHVFKTIETTEEKATINVDEESIQAVIDEGVIYSITVTNNKLITKTYALDVSSDINGSITVYPSDGVSVQPGETNNIYIYVTPESIGDFTISYTVMEDDVDVGSGSLSLSVSELQEEFGLTGYIVAAGGVFGVAGLIVLILFIYFYFIRQPPKKEEDAFKPVEVKKAELGKPKTRNEGEKYW